MLRVLQHAGDAVRGQAARIRVDQRARGGHGHIVIGAGARQHARRERFQRLGREIRHSASLQAANCAARRRNHRHRCHGSRSRSTLPPVRMMPTSAPATSSVPFEQAGERHRGRRLDDDLHPLPDHPHRAHDRVLAGGADRGDVGAQRGQRARRKRRAQPVGDRRRIRQRLDRARAKAPRRIVGVGRFGAEDADRGPERRRGDRRSRQQAAAADGRDDDVERAARPRAAPAPRCPAPRSRARRRTDGRVAAPVSRCTSAQVASRAATVGLHNRIVAPKRRTLSCFTCGALSGMTTHAGMPRRAAA